MQPPNSHARIVVATLDDERAQSGERCAVRLRDEGAEVIWLGVASVAAIVGAVVQEAADEVRVVGADRTALAAIQGRLDGEKSGAVLRGGGHD